MLSVKALRLYAENGLLRPTWVDPSSGYRYYDPQLAPTGRLIAMLRDADVPLVDVRALVVASSEEASELLAVLKTRMRQHRSSADLLIDRVGGHLRSGAGEAVTDDGVTIRACRSSTRSFLRWVKAVVPFRVPVVTAKGAGVV